MATEENKALAYKWVQAWNTDTNLDIIEDVFAPNWRHRNPLPGGTEGIEGAKQLVRFFRNSFSDIHLTIDLLMAEGDLVMLRWIADATHTGQFYDIPPSGRRVSFSGMTVHRVAEGKFVETANEIDFLGLLQQVQSYTTG